MILRIAWLILRVFVLSRWGTWTNPTDPVSGTVITVAYAVANFLAQIRWLRLLTGNSDPPGSSYVVVSTSTSGTSWQKVPTDAIADLAITTAKLANGAVTPAKMSYTPVNLAGDTMTGPLTINLTAAGTGGLVIRNLDPAGIGLAIRNALGTGFDLLLDHGTAAFGGALSAISGSFSGAVSTGTLASTINAVGTAAAAFWNANAAGISLALRNAAGSGFDVLIDHTTAAFSVAISGTSATFSGVVSASINVAATATAILHNQHVSGISLAVRNAGATGFDLLLTHTAAAFGVQITSSVTTGTAPFSVASTTEVANLNASRVAGKIPTAIPTAGALPLADAGGTLDSWVSSAVVYAPPVGLVALYGGASAPAKWAFCDGAAVSRTTYSALFAVLGGSYGAGDGSTTFTLPDFRDRFAIGKSGTKALGATGGAATVDLTHNHSGSPMSVSGTTSGPAGTNTAGGTGSTNADGSHTHTYSASVAGNTANQGGQTAVGILPPYQAANYIIYTGV